MLPPIMTFKFLKQNVIYNFRYISMNKKIMGFLKI